MFPEIGMGSGAFLYDRGYNESSNNDEYPPALPGDS